MANSLHAWRSLPRAESWSGLASLLKQFFVLSYVGGVEENMVLMAKSYDTSLVNTAAHMLLSAHVLA